MNAWTWQYLITGDLFEDPWIKNLMGKAREKCNENKGCGGGGAAEGDSGPK